MGYTNNEGVIKAFVEGREADSYDGLFTNGETLSSNWTHIVKRFNKYGIKWLVTRDLPYYIYWKKHREFLFNQLRGKFALLTDIDDLNSAKETFDINVLEMRKLKLFISRAKLRHKKEEYRKGIKFLRGQNELLKPLAVAMYL